MNGILKGYGIETFPDGGVYRGQFEDSDPQGYGHMRYADNNEYDGQWD